MSYSAFDIANYFLWKADTEKQELLSNLKLQKLLYYAQGLHLVLYGSPLFPESIAAWKYGPVVEELYHFYKEHEVRGIPANPEFDPNTIDKDTRDFLDEIYEVFGQFSAIRLMDIAHKDQCWIDAGLNCEISHSSMKEHLAKYLKDG